MELIACDAPSGSLADAPQSSLRRDSGAERWDGFWGEDDRYYARLTWIDSGREQWFHLVDSIRENRGSGAVTPAQGGVRRGAARRGAHIYLVRRRGGSRHPGIVRIRHAKGA